MNHRIRSNVTQIQPYKPGKPIEEVERELGITCIKLASNENCLGPSPKALAAMRDVLAQSHLYPDGGAYMLKVKLAGLLEFPSSQICMGNGSSEIIPLLALITCTPRDSMVMSAQSFVMYRLAAQLVDAQCIETPLRDFRHDLAAMSGAIRENTRLLFMDNPINPTGTYVTTQEMDRFIDTVPPDVLVVVDEAYREYIDREDYPDATSYIREGRSVVVLRTFSKVYGLAGLRLGYCIGPPDIIEGLNKIRPPFNTASLAQVAGIAALDDVEHVSKSREMVLREIRFVERELTRRGFKYVPSVANFILVDLDQDARKAFEKLLALGVIVRPMHGYNFPTSVRVTIGTHDENVRFVEALDRMNDCA